MKFSGTVKVFTCYLLSEEKEPTINPFTPRSLINKTEVHAGRAEGLLEANQFILQELQPYNQGKVEETATLTNNVGVGEGTIIHGRTTIRGPVVIGEHCEIGPNTYIGPYTSIGDNSTILNTEAENSIIMEGAHIDCGRRIVDSLIGRNVKILSSEKNIPEATDSS
jgi:glucose-1-phosphate thymidylyltransferase